MVAVPVAAVPPVLVATRLKVSGPSSAASCSALMATRTSKVVALLAILGGLVAS